MASLQASAAASSPLSQSGGTFFEDNFDGIAIDSTKWNSTFATSGLRWCSSTVENHHSNPGNWQDTSTIPCHGLIQGPPYGTVGVGGGLASFSSFSSRTFPYIWRGQPSKDSPFPSRGDFILEVRMRYNFIAGFGDGVFVNNWNSTDPVGNNPPAGQARVFMIWADSNGMFVFLMGQLFTVFNPAGFHDFLLEYIGGEYFVAVDGFPAIGPVASSVRPNNIWIGNPVFTFWGISDWSAFSLDLVRVAVPVLQLTPDNGSLGTKVTVQGSGFPSPSLGPRPSQVPVTFDDMFLGFAAARNGTFTFTFDVPHAEPGPHLVKAFDPLTGVRAVADFKVLAPPGGLTVSLDVGSIYFPGDTAVVYVLTSQSGTPVGPSGLTLRLTLTKPDGSGVTLNATSLGPGLFKATYLIPRNGSLGTYALTARASVTGGANGSALRSFEVKLSWLNAQGGTVVSAAAIVGMVAVAAVAWRKGLLRTSRED